MRHSPGLGPHDGPPFLLNLRPAQHPALVVCDHASNAVPTCLAGLGLTNEALAQHIAWDIGAAALALRLAALLGISAVRTGYSRLVVDCNRHLTDPSSMVAVSDGVAIPGNENLNDAQRAWRHSALFEPYHLAIEQQLSLLAAAGRAPALIAVHSFTPVMNGFARPWQCGVLWDRDDRLARPLLAALRAESGLVVGDNQPYSGQHPADYTIDVHAERRRWPAVCVEVRQDQLLTSVGVEAWAQRLAQALAPLLADEKLYEP